MEAWTKLTHRLGQVPLVPVFVVAGFVILVFSVMRTVGVAIVVSNDAANAAAVVHNFHPAELSESQLLIGYLDVETGLRGYVLTGDSTFLAPYLQGTSDVLKQYSILHAALAPYPKLTAQLNDVEAAGRAWELAATLHEIVPSLGETGLKSAVLASLNSDRAQFDQLRGQIDLLTHSTIATDESARNVQTSALVRLRTAVLTSGILSVAIITLIGIIFWLLLIRPMRRLESSATFVSGGDLDHKVTIDGVREISSLSKSIDAMRLGILRETDTRRRAASLEAQLNERREIAEAVHDNPLQLLAAAKIRLQLSNSNEASAEAVAPAIALIDMASAWMRNMITSIYPPGLVRGNLAEALAEHLASIQLGLEPFIVSRVSLDGLRETDIHSEPSILLAFRCVQEFTTNAVKRAPAGPIQLILEANPQGFRVACSNATSNEDLDQIRNLSEDMRGLSRRRHRQSGHLGIPLLIDSIEAVGGRFAIRAKASNDHGASFKVIYQSHALFRLIDVPESDSAEATFSSISDGEGYAHESSAWVSFDVSIPYLGGARPAESADLPI